MLAIPPGSIKDGKVTAADRRPPDGVEILETLVACWDQENVNRFVRGLNCELAPEDMVALEAEYGAAPTLTQLAEQRVISEGIAVVDPEWAARVYTSWVLQSWAGFTHEQVRDEADRMQKHRKIEEASSKLESTMFDPSDESWADSMLARGELRIRWGRTAEEDAISRWTQRMTDLGMDKTTIGARLVQVRRESAKIDRVVREARTASTGTSMSEPLGATHAVTSAGCARARSSAGGPRRRSRAASASSGGDGGDGEPGPADEHQGLRHRSVEPHPAAPLIAMRS